MSVDITEELRQAIDRENGTPVYLVDSEKGETYVLLAADMYQRYQALFESEEFDIRETYAAQDQVAESAWSHPETLHTMTTTLTASSHDRISRRCCAC